ncbi:MAG: family 16 glycoside hydrolase [Verrucomicrobiia bacterium]
MKSICFGAGGLLLCGCLVASDAVSPGWVEIFDGRSLGGWAAPDMSYWSVRDGAITGTSKEPIASNHYLVWQGGKPADFELSLCFRIQGTPQANSGVQFRSKVQPNGFVEGYQADIARYAEHCGVLYDETPGRGLLARRGQRLGIDETGQRVSASFANDSDLFKVVRLDDWNEYHIVARGSWVSARLNGSLVWQVVDRDASRRADEPGVIAFQLHSGPPMTIQFKDIRLRDLTPLHADRPNPFFAFCMDTHDSKKRNLAEQAALLSELGYAGAGHLWLDSVAERLATLDATGLRLFQIYLSVNVGPEAAQPYDPRLRQILPLLRARDTMLAVLMSGGKPSDTSLDQRAVAILSEMAELANAHGIKLALYPHTGDWLERIEDAVRLVRKTGRPNIGVMFNLCHFLKAEDEKNLKSAIELAGDHLFAVSINGSDSGEEIKTGKGRWIAPLGVGSFDQAAFLKLLRDKGYRGPVGLQCYGIPGDAFDHLAASIKQWRRLNEPE